MAILSVKDVLFSAGLIVGLLGIAALVAGVLFAEDASYISKSAQISLVFEKKQSSATSIEMSTVAEAREKVAELQEDVGKKGVLLKFGGFCYADAFFYPSLPGLSIRQSNDAIQVLIGDRIRVTAILLPLWFVIFLVALPIAWFIRKIRSTNKKKDYECKKCSYILLGNESGICPECGNMIDTLPD